MMMALIMMMLMAMMMMMLMAILMSLLCQRLSCATVVSECRSINFWIIIMTMIMMMMKMTMTVMVKMVAIVTMMKSDQLSKSNKTIAEDHQFIYKHAPFTSSTLIPNHASHYILFFCVFLGHPRPWDGVWLTCLTFLVEDLKPDFFLLSCGEKEKWWRPPLLQNAIMLEWSGWPLANK